MHFPQWVDLKGQDSVPETVHHVVSLLFGKIIRSFPSHVYFGFATTLKSARPAIVCKCPSVELGLTVLLGVGDGLCRWPLAFSVVFQFLLKGNIEFAQVPLI